MWIVLIGTALGQGIVNGDFEGGDTAGWSDESWVLEYTGGGTYDSWPWFLYTGSSVLTVDTLVARGAGSGLVAVPGGWYDPYCTFCNEFTIDVRSDPFVITHTEFDYAIVSSGFDVGFGVGLVSADALEGLPTFAIPASPSTDTFTNVALDTSPACGALALVRLSWHQDGEAEWWLDDLGLTGTVCPMFADVDGDGLCLAGVDIDGDGDCADPAEPRPEDRIDCDDADPSIGACLEVMSHDLWMEPNTPYDIVIAGAAPGEAVRLVTGPGPGTTCPFPLLGPVCFDLAGPVNAIDHVIADATGTAVFAVVPRRAQAAAYTTRWLQAAVVRPTGLLVSQVVTTAVRPETGPAPDPGFVNGGFEDDLTGWVPMSAVYWPAWWDELYPCPGGTADPAIGRGVGSLYVANSWQPGFLLGCENTTRSWPVHVTHRALTWAHLGGAGRLRVFDRVDGAEVALVPFETEAPDGFTEAVADLGAACGGEVYVDISGGGDGEPGAWWDDVQLAGPPCPELVDHDGDGECAEGIDLDGDGACVSAGEYEPGTPEPEPLAVVIADLEDATMTMGPECADPTTPPDAYCDDCWPGSGAEGQFCPGAWLPISVFELRDYADTPELPPLGTRGMWLDNGWSSGGWVLFGATDWGMPAHLVTHQRLGLSVLLTGEGDWRSMTLYVDAGSSTGAGVPVQTPVGTLPPRVWGQHVVDLSARCGEWLGGAIRMEGSNMYTVWDDGIWSSPDMAYIDDFGFLGPTCPIFVDDDGDGTCPEGVDLDGDGECVSDGEPTPGVLQE